MLPGRVSGEGEEAFLPYVVKRERRGEIIWESTSKEERALKKKVFVPSKERGPERSLFRKKIESLRGGVSGTYDRTARQEKTQE